MTYNPRDERKIPDIVVRMELISHFNLYPDTVITCSDMSLRIDRELERVERQMEALVGLEILQKVGEGEGALYSYLPPISRAVSARTKSVAGGNSPFSERNPGGYAGGCEPDSGAADKARGGDVSGGMAADYPQARSS